MTEPTHSRKACPRHGLAGPDAGQCCPSCGEELLAVDHADDAMVLRAHLQTRRSRRVSLAVLLGLLAGLAAAYAAPHVGIQGPFDGREEALVVPSADLPPAEPRHEPSFAVAAAAFLIVFGLLLLVYRLTTGARDATLEPLVSADACALRRRLLTGTPVFLALALVGLHLLSMVDRGWVAEHLTLVPARLREGRDLHTLLTAGVLHGDGAHLVINVLLLVSVGRSADLRLGRWWSLLLFVVALVAGAVFHALLTERPDIPTVGAGAGIYGFFAAQLVLLPTMRHLLTMPYRSMAIFVPNYVLMPLLVATMTLFDAFARPQLAWLGQLGGFAAGLVLSLPLRRTPRHALFDEYLCRRKTRMEEASRMTL
jgi:membrane associated rhomboid family serine protease